MENQVDLITNSVEVTDRKILIPLWIKVFSWLFFVFGLIAPLGLVFGVLGYPFELALYGLQTSNPGSVPGLIICLLFILKGIVSFGILFSKSWAVKLAIIDAIVGIAVCTFCMIYAIYYYHNFSFRIEIVALIPYLLKMQKIKTEWEREL